MPKKYHKHFELILTGSILLLLLFLINPWGWWMPTMQITTLCVLLFAAMVSYALFIIRERPQDEREEYHLMVLGRVSFLTGAFVLVAGLIWQSYSHQVDPWLVLTLAVMVLTKTIGGIWLHHNR